MMLLGCFLYGETTLTEANDVKKDHDSQGCKSKCDLEREERVKKVKDWKANYWRKSTKLDMAIDGVSSWCKENGIEVSDQEGVRKCIGAFEKGVVKEEWKECLSDCNLRYE